MSEAAQWLRDVPLAHRGLHGDGVPENSLPAFDAAARAGVGIELDVRLTLDGIAVIAHDRDLRRTTGQALRVDQTRFEVIEGLRLIGSDEPMPTLEQALAVIAGRVPVMVEVKNETLRMGRVEQVAADALSGYRGPRVVASFNPVTVRWFARHAPTIDRVLTGGSADVVPRMARPALQSLLRRRWGNPVALSWNVERLDDPTVIAARQDGLPVTTWTVRTMDDLVRARAGADNVIFEGLTVAEVSLPA